jgi:hypothetical protein
VEAHQQVERELAARADRAHEEAERERRAREQAERELVARERAARELAERLAREQAERERLVREATEREARLREQAPAGGALTEQALREQAERDKLMRELAAGAQALAEAVKASQQRPAPAPTRRPSLRPARRTARPRKAKPRPSRSAGELQDEWGIYDASICGFDALYARLEAQEQGLDAAGSDARDPFDKSRRRGDKAGQERRGPRPLAMWARQNKEGDAAGASATAQAQAAQDDVNALMRGLQLPPPIAIVGFAAGCRIRRIRVKARKSKRKKPTNGRLVIVSRKVLDQLRPPRTRSLVATAAPAPARTSVQTSAPAAAPRDRRRRAS